jgi:hypothetical protein
MLTPTKACRLSPGDQFVPDRSLADAVEHGWRWTIVEHVFTGRGDYSTVVESDDTTWTERFWPDDPVWLEE